MRSSLVLNSSAFYDEFPDFLDFATTSDGDLLIIGDFNVHFEDLGDSRARKFRELLQTCGLSQAINEPTYPASNHILDLVIFRDTDGLLLSAQCCYDLKSDHYSLVCHLNVPKPKLAPQCKSVRAIHKIDHVEFSHDLATTLTPVPTVTDLNTTLRKLLDKHAPVRQRAVRQHRWALWYNSVASELQKLERERRRAERCWVSSRLTVHKQIYNATKQKVVECVHQAKTAFYSSKVAAASSCKELFKTVTSMLGKTVNVFMPSTHEPSQLPGLFSQFFTDKIETIRNAFSLSPDTSDVSAVFTGTALCEFSPVSEQFVHNIITQSIKTSCDLDPIPTPLLFEHLDSLLPIITKILNESLSSGTVPTEFKTAIVKPLLKKNNLDPNVLGNYRPISNLPFLSKILEKVIFHQLSDHLASNNLLTPHQSAYRSGHSTETAILRILTDILNSLDENKISVLLLLDLSAAFDTVDHQILLSRLNHTFGIRETALNWFRSYLSGRKQFDHRSSESPLKYGVPQGSVLGPVLFILYTTPLSDVIRGHSVSHEMFADDTQLLHSSAIDDYPTLTSTLQSCTSDVDTWMSANKLKLNCEKTEAVRFYRQPHHSPDLLPSSLMLGSSTIEFSDTVRDLGVLLDSDLSMKQHVTKTCQLAYMELKKIAAIRPFLTEDATKTLVSSYILSRLDYCNCVLLGCPSNVIHPLQRIQNSAARLICKSPWSQPCSPLLKKLHWLPVEERIIYKCCCLCFKVLTGDAPAYLSDLLHVYVPSRTLRSSADTRIFRLPNHRPNRKQHGERAFSYAAVHHWNNLPYTVRHCQSLSTFKTSLKTHLFSKHFC